MNIPNTERVSRQVVAAMLGISSRHVSNLLRAGVLVQVAKGKYDLVDSVHRYAKYLQQGGSASGELASARQQTERERARKLKFENDLAEGRLVPAEDVRIALFETMRIIASNEDAIPGRLAQKLVNMTSAASIRQLLLTELRRGRATAADRIEAYAAKAGG